MSAVATPFFEGGHFWEGVAAMGTFTLAFVKWALPSIAKRWTRWRNWVLVRDGKAAVTVNGIPVSPVILSIPVRLKNLDDGQLAILTKIDAHGVSLERIETKMGAMFENGKDTNSTGDLIARMATQQGVYLENPNTEKETP